MEFSTNPADFVTYKGRDGELRFPRSCLANIGVFSEFDAEVIYGSDPIERFGDVISLLCDSQPKIKWQDYGNELIEDYELEPKAILSETCMQHYLSHQGVKFIKEPTWGYVVNTRNQSIPLRFGLAIHPSLLTGEHKNQVTLDGFTFTLEEDAVSEEKICVTEELEVEEIVTYCLKEKDFSNKSSEYQAFITEPLLKLFRKHGFRKTKRLFLHGI